MHFRVTLVKPRPGSESEVERILGELDASMAEEPGLVMSLLLRQHAPLRYGRVALWRSRDDADRLATSHQTLALRSSLQHHILEREGHVDSMLAVSSLRSTSLEDIDLDDIEIEEEGY